MCIATARRGGKRMITSNPIQYAPLWSDAFTSFIQYKRGLGFQYDRPEYDLMELSRFLVAASDNLLEIPKETAEQWCKRRQNESDNNWLTRVTIYRQLAKYLSSKGINAYIPDNYRISVPKYIPYIFSEEEIIHIISYASSIKCKRINSYDRLLSIVIKLMFTTGMRISEVVNLRIEDVNTSEKTLYIHESKNRKSRLIPIDASVSNMLEEYRKTWEAERVFFFETRKHTKINSDTVYRYFRKICLKAGIHHGGRGSGPRLHDIRHTFAVRSLHHMTKQGLDTYTALPYLAAYLGHKKIPETEYYLRLTSELYPEIEQMASSYTGNVIPEV